MIRLRRAVTVKEGAAGVCALAVLATALVVSSRQPTLAQDKAGPAAYLEKMSSPGQTPYHARQLVVFMGEPQSAAVLDIRSSPRATFVRAEAGGDVVKLWRRPGAGIVAAAEDVVRDDAPPGPAVRAEDVMAKYDVTTGPSQKMLGVDVVPLTLVRRGDQVQVERMWIHPRSGVVYRRELFGRSGKLIGLSTIIDMRWGEDAAVEPYEAGPVPAARALATTDGRAPTRLPYGYALSGAYAIKIRGQQTTQWVYSDGLHTLSVFATKGAMRTPDGFVTTRLAGTRAFAGPGPGTWAWEGDGHSWVVVAEEPDLDPARLLAAFPRDSRSVWARMGSVWSRLFGWVGGRFS